MSTAALPNEQTHFFYDENLAKAISTGLQETLHEMCRLSCEFEDSFIAQKWAPIGQASASVELVSEDQRGLLQVHFSDVATLTIMSKLLGRAPMQVNEEALDCAGSLIGIIYGRMKAILNPLGYSFKMASPQMSYTKNLSQPAEGVRHLIIPFKVANSKCFMQVVLYA